MNPKPENQRPESWKARLQAPENIRPRRGGFGFSVLGSILFCSGSGGINLVYMGTLWGVSRTNIGPQYFKVLVVIGSPT